MATWSAIVGEVGVNLLTNPVFGNGTTDWSAINGTLTTDTTASNLLFGSTAGAYSGTSLAANSGVQGNLQVTATAVTGQVEFWIKGTAPEKLGVYDGVWVYSSTPTVLETGPNGYTRYGATFSAADMSGVTKAGAFWSGTISAYIGGAQCEQSSTYTTQIVGDMGPGYAWNGTEHQSASTRYILDENGRAVWGGSIVALDDGTSILCEGMVGVGLLPLEIEKLAIAGEITNIFIGQSLAPRDIQLALFFDGTSLANTHTLRAALLAKLPYGREVWLRYHGANATLQIKAAVAGSFDPDFGSLPFGQKTGLQFTALDPRFSYTGPERTTITFTSSPSSSYARQRTDKDGWAAMSSGLYAVPRRAIRGPDGTIYVGTAASAATAKVQKWTGSAWTDLVSLTGSITSGPVVNELLYINNNFYSNELVIFGDFTQANGSSAVGFASVNLSTGVVGAGSTAAAGGAPLCAVYDPVLNQLYVGGAFTSWYGAANTSYIVGLNFNSIAWYSLGTTRPTAAVYCMVADAQGSITMAGDFTNTFPLLNMSSTTAALATGGAKQNGWNFTYRVVARDSAGGLTTGVDSSTLTGTTTQGSANVSWSAVTGAAGYRLFCNETSVGSGRRDGITGWTAVVDLPAGTLSYYDDGTAYLAALRSTEHTPPSGNTTGDYGSRIVKWVASTGAWERMAQKSGGFNGIVRTLALAGHGGTLIAGGSFTTADGGTANRVAYTRGKRWLPLGSAGMSSGQVNRVVYDRGRVWAVGSFASADGDTLAPLLATLDGFPAGSWRHTDVALANSSNNAYDIIVQPYRLMVFDDTTFSSAAGATSISYTGTANLYPKFRVTGPGVLRSIRNGLTGARLVFNYTLFAGERLVIDCEARRVTSTIRGDITALLHPSSQLDAFYLVASQTQTLWVHMTGTTGASSVVMEGYRALLTGDI